MSLKDKVCIVTGGGSGIGRSSALIMAREGATVILVGRTASKVEDVKAEVASAGGVAEAFPLDVADHDAVTQMATTVLEGFGRIDVLVNNAGHSSPHRRLMSTSPQEIRSVIDSNLVGTIFCTQAVMPAMLEAGEGTIINVSSLAGLNPGLIGGMVYSAAKAAVINFTGFLNIEFRNTGVRASVVIPGEIDTPIMDKRPVPPSAEARTTMATAEDVAEAITLIARLPGRATIPELTIRPTMLRDTSAEVSRFP
ncbi:MAG: SDR family oxidoreductase [Chloroflexi bacterium]|nr:SDR family oxidoreductase [Chloroflexota bacterium]